MILHANIIYECGACEECVAIEVQLNRSLNVIGGKRAINRELGKWGWLKYQGEFICPDCMDELMCYDNEYTHVVGSLYLRVATQEVVDASNDMRVVGTADDYREYIGSDLPDAGDDAPLDEEGVIDEQAIAAFRAIGKMAGFAQEF